MGKKKKSEKHIHKPALKIKEMPEPKWIVPFILIISFAAFIPTLTAGFVNYDDPDYVNNNLLIRHLSNVPALITTPVQGNYHPLTMISLAINFAISGTDAWSYHLTNLLFHLVNCFLVFRLAMLLSNKNFIIAFTAAALFGVHPMHVESVAWISERKDVLYTLFFLAALISYTKYVDTNAKKKYGWALLFLVLSLLSKPAAIVFPLVVFCIDLLRKRKLSLKLIFEKIPFVIPAIVMAILTYNAQTDVGATGASVIGMGTRFLVGFYGIMMYVFKLFIPFNQSPFYPFPLSYQNLPVIYYIGPVFFIVLAILFFYSLKKERAVAFGISFYLANLILVLQVLPVGAAVISERYTYVPYIGLFYALGWLINRFTIKDPQKAFSIIIFVSFFFAFRSFNQSKTWHDGTTLWDNAIESKPSSKAYRARAALLRDEKKYTQALDYYKKALELNKTDYEVYTDRATIYMDMQYYDAAYSDYRNSLLLRPNYYVTIDNLGALFSVMQKNDSALIYLNQAIRLKPDYKVSYRNRALTYMQMKRYDEAVKDFETFLVYEPNAAMAYNTIGVCYRLQNKFSEAVASVSKAIAIEPQPAFYLNRSRAYYGLNNLLQAKQDAMTARQGGVPIEPGYARSIGL